MLLYNKLIAFKNRIQECDEFKNDKVILAYPSVRKPTKLTKLIITVSVGEINAGNIELGGESLYGSYMLNATIFVPYKLTTAVMPSAIEAVIKSQITAYPSAVRVSEISAHDETECFSVKCGFTFNDEIDFGG